MVTGETRRGLFPAKSSLAIQIALFASLLAVCAHSARSQSPHKSSNERAARVVTVNFESRLVNAVLPYRVVLPPGYSSAHTKRFRYPTLYLLHGLGGHYSDWTSKTRLIEYAAQYEIVIVTPEGKDGWYTDSATVPTDKYESYIIEELIPDVERRFRVTRDRNGRAIAGLSMGGYGALKFGIKHPGLFSFAASLSGALDAATWREEDLRGRQSIWRSLVPVFGPMDHPGRSANDLRKLLEQLPPEDVAGLPFFYLDCGSEDPFLSTNRDFEDVLLKRRIPHEFRILHGGHEWVYWNKQVAEVLRVAVKRMATTKVLGPLT